MLLFMFYLEAIYFPTLKKVIRSSVANELLCKVLVHSQMCVYRFHIPLLILLANDVEMNPGSCDRVDSSKTVTADYHQGDVSLFGMSVCKQCAAVCFTARTIYPECF